MTLNVRSLASSSRYIELSHILHHHQIDVGFIQECHLYTNKKARLDGYNFIYDNSDIGVAVVIKNTIHFNIISFSGTRLNNSFIQIEMHTNNNSKKYFIESIYIPCIYPF